MDDYPELMVSIQQNFYPTGAPVTTYLRSKVNYLSYALVLSPWTVLSYPQGITVVLHKVLRYV